MNQTIQILSVIGNKSNVIEYFPSDNPNDGIILHGSRVLFFMYVIHILCLSYPTCNMYEDTCFY